MDEYDDSTPSPLRTALTVLLIVLVPLALGIFLAGRLLPRPQVGIVRLEDALRLAGCQVQRIQGTPEQIAAAFQALQATEVFLPTTPVGQ